MRVLASLTSHLCGLVVAVGESYPVVPHPGCRSLDESDGPRTVASRTGEHGNGSPRWILNPYLSRQSRAEGLIQMQIPKGAGATSGQSQDAM
jgi:hypothetical protein